jgi:hypothetical protein
LIPFLSSEWFETLRRATRDVAIAPGDGCRIQFDAGGTRFGLVVESGRITLLEATELDRPDVEVRSTLPDAAKIWRRELRDDDAMRAITVVAPVADGTYTGPPSPADLLGRPELDAAPSVPGASLVVAYAFSGGPFGRVHHWLRYEDGRPVEEGFGEPASADVRIGTRYREIALIRSGEHTVLDALDGGTIEGAIGPMALLAGILESPEYEAAELASGTHGDALSVLGELWARPEWVTALDVLAERTAPA